MRDTLTFVAQRRAWLALLLAWAVLYLPWLAAEPLRGTLEANRLQASREMLASGDWVVPTLNGETYLLKPPLQYWLISAASAPFGEVTLVGGRALSAVCVLAAMLCIFAWGARELGRETGVLAALVFATSGIVFEKGVRAELETLLAAATAAAMFGLWRAAFSERQTARSVAGAAFALSAALLVKGPVVLLMLIPAALVLIVRERGRRAVVSARCAAILVLGLAGTLPWVIALVERSGSQGPLRTLFVQFLGRVEHAGITNAEPFWFYGPALLGALAPWTLLLPGLAFARRRRLDERRRSSAAWFLGVWALGTLVLLSFSAGKETRYLIASIPAWSLWIADGFENAAGPLAFDRYRMILARVSAVVAWIAPWILAAAAWKLRPGARALPYVIALLGLAACALCHHGLRTRRSILTASGLLAGLFVLKLFWAEVYMADLARRHPIAELALFIQKRLAPGESLIELGPYSAPIHFMADRPLRVVNDYRELELALHDEREGALSTDQAVRWVLAQPALLADDWEGELEPVREWQLGSTRWRLLVTRNLAGSRHKR